MINQDGQPVPDGKTFQSFINKTSWAWKSPGFTASQGNGETLVRPGRDLERPEVRGKNRNKGLGDVVAVRNGHWTWHKQ
ncbi:hypothetical protein ElyMa_005597700 [Elysia marginata]|uniref:MIB/HERC2 domain-containing protein n=1 Tax=Elysia marginata TaxID=1093978 RepID=A0AAV4F429_9GAST|nr:hypothetical protein ElyMa_005597700 [Elysia marginata]